MFASFFRIQRIRDEKLREAPNRTEASILAELYGLPANATMKEIEEAKAEQTARETKFLAQAYGLPADATMADIKEAQAKRTARDAEDAARKLEEEFDSDGLVLMLKTVVSHRDHITGEVVNRRNHKLSLATIRFALYDASGAQVGSAIDAINDLEPNARWKFKASTFGKSYRTQKVSELTGH